MSEPVLSKRVKVNEKMENVEPSNPPPTEQAKPVERKPKPKQPSQVTVVLAPKWSVLAWMLVGICLYIIIQQIVYIYYYEKDEREQLLQCHIAISRLSDLKSVVAKL